MKGFVYLLEIAVASILIVVILSAFFAIRVKQNWNNADLVAVGNNIIDYLNNDDNFLKVLETDFTGIEKVKPANVGYGIRVLGSPKTNITVGCTELSCGYLQSILTPAYVNGRYIVFDVQNYHIENGIPDFDAIVLVNYTGYTAEKENIKNYLDNGGVVLGINATYSNDNADFNEIFGLQPSGSVSNPNKFVTYDPSLEDVEKYFMGIGFDVNSIWYLWGDAWNVIYRNSYINITRGTEVLSFLNTGEEFVINGNTFKVKSFDYNSGEAIIQAARTGFIFEDFSDLNDVEGNKILGPSGSAASMASNKNAIWISDFEPSDEYKSLLKAAIISRNDEWIAKGVYTTRETTTVSSFFSQCCDMTEVSELEITLWYVL
ncbi:MAG: hypothetical protein JW700_01955 [Candidatus Aenigmarchaeota archaeon]|nr:hypothetical protein [Candidatus Aenigmarchaeota archaeon]